jgi:hypothetical protein
MEAQDRVEDIVKPKEKEVEQDMETEEAGKRYTAKQLQPIASEAERVEVVSPHEIIQRMTATQRRLQAVNVKFLRVKAWVHVKTQQKIREIEQIQRSAQEISDLLNNDSSSQPSPEQRIEAENRLKEIVADIFSIFEQIFPLSPIELFCSAIERANYRQVKPFLDKNLNQLDEQRLHIVKEKLSKEERKIRQIEQQINAVCLSAQKVLDSLHEASPEERTKAMDIITKGLTNIFTLFEQNLSQISIELFCSVIKMADYRQVKPFLEKNLNQLDEQRLNIIKERFSKEEEWKVREIEQMKQKETERQMKQMEIKQQMKQMEIEQQLEIEQQMKQMEKMEQQQIEIKQQMKQMEIEQHMKQMEIEQQMNEMCLGAQAMLDLLRDPSFQLSSAQRTEAMDMITKGVGKLFSIFEQNFPQISIELFCSVIKIANHRQVESFLEKNLNQLDEQRVNIVKERLSKEEQQQK